jgi:hypothetical protein
MGRYCRRDRGTLARGGSRSRYGRERIRVRADRGRTRAAPVQELHRAEREVPPRPGEARRQRQNLGTLPCALAGRRRPRQARCSLPTRARCRARSCAGSGSRRSPRSGSCSIALVSSDERRRQPTRFPLAPRGTERMPRWRSWTRASRLFGTWRPSPVDITGRGRRSWLRSPRCWSRCSR